MEALSRNWGWVVFRGIVSILFGVAAFMNPGITLALGVRLRSWGRLHPADLAARPA